MALTGLTACSTGGSTNNSSGPPQSNVTLTVSRWSGPQADEQKVLLDQYTKETGVKIQFDAIDYAQLQQKQTLNMSTKTGGYDLIYVPEGWVGSYANSGYLTKLDDMVKDTTLTGAGWDYADIQKSGIDTYTVNGSLYGLPYFVQTPLLVYDKDALKAAGLSVPKTWDDILKAAKYFKEHGTGIALPFRQGTAIGNLMAVLLAGDNTGFFDKSGKLDLTNSKVVETVQFIQDLSKYGLEGSNGWHWDEVNKALQFAQAPMGFTTSGLFSALEDPSASQVAGKLSYAPVPYASKAAGLIQSWSWAIPADSKNQKEAFKLGAWLTSKEQQKAMATVDPGFISFRQSLADDKALVANAPWLPAIKEALSNGVTLPLQPAATEFLTALDAGLSGVVTNGDDPKTMLQGVQASEGSKF